MDLCNYSTSSSDEETILLIGLVISLPNKRKGSGSETYSNEEMEAGRLTLLGKQL